MTCAAVRGPDTGPGFAIALGMGTWGLVRDGHVLRLF